jgi:hypothetical protein
MLLAAAVVQRLKPVNRVCQIYPLSVLLARGVGTV